MRNSGSARLARWAIALGSIATFMATAPAANATISSVFTSSAAPIPCAVQGSGVRLCDQTIAGNPGGTARSPVPTFDGVPIDVRVAFPPKPASGPDGPYPLIMFFHGYGGHKLILSNMQPFLDAGYATFSMTTRGFGQSCGTAASRTALGTACDIGYVRLMDTRYEVRDAQELAGMLADDGVTSPTQIGAIGGSYGGGMSMALAALKDRKMLPNGSLVPWQSPLGTPMQIAAAAPEIPWTDLFYALLPNGSTLDYVADAPYQGRTGVLKSSWENGLYNSGLSFFYAPAGLDPDADLMNWHAFFNAGEPYDDASGNPMPAAADIRDELTTHHSSYYIDHSEAPAPMLISSGFTDDLFPADETLRFYNRTRTQYPSTPISLLYASFGHQRAQNKAADVEVRSAAKLAWMNYYVKGVGSPLYQGVEALTQTCPNSTPSGGPYFASSWDKLAPGEIRFGSAAPQTILPTAGSTAIAAAFDPATGGGACATATATDQADTATYRLDPVPTGGFTLMGSPTVVADITSAGSNSQIAARLLDVNTTTNTETLVARGFWRPAISGTPVQQVFQLHPNGYKFVDGHVVKLELLPKDSGTAAENSYGRTSNGQANVTVENLSLRLPVLESSGSLGGLVQTPAPKVLPAGSELAPGFGTFSAPSSAPSLDVPLTPVFKECGTGGQPANASHHAPFSDSCDPPIPTAAIARVGKRAIGFASLSMLPGNISVTVDSSDVRAGGVTGADYDPNPGSPDMTMVARIRLTDYANGASGSDPATGDDIGLVVPVDCVKTIDQRAGATCSANTTVDALTPGAITAGKSTVVQSLRVQLLDAGSNGVQGDSDDTLFEQEGVVIP